MFTTADRAALLDLLTEHARADEQVTAAALVGSAARGEVDRWSDIDLALRLRAGAQPMPTAEGWTQWLGGLRTVSDHLDVWSGSALYRVFLLADSLQVDLSFWPDEAFGSDGQAFELLFGSAGPPAARVPTDATDPAALVGWGWLYALHVRSALARGRTWQAVQMLEGLRSRVIGLACLRHGLPPAEGRGTDRLPDDLLQRLRAALPHALDVATLSDSFDAAVDLLAAEARLVDPGLADRLHEPLRALRPGGG